VRTQKRQCIKGIRWPR